MNTETKQDGMWIMVCISDIAGFSTALEALRQREQGKTVSRLIEEAVIAQAGVGPGVNSGLDTTDDAKVLRIVRQFGPVTAREARNYARTVPNPRILRSIERLLAAGAIEAAQNNRTTRYSIREEQEGESV